MEKRIELEKRGRFPKEIHDLNLDNCRSTSIVGLSDEFESLESLSLINVGLTSLKGFPKLPNLKKLELSDNRINNGLNLLATSPKLTHLNLSGNRIKDLDTLQPLKDFKHLKTLDLFNNEATSIEHYRSEIFDLIPSLKYLDGFDAHDAEAEDSDDEVNGNGNENETGNEDDSEEVSSEEEDCDMNLGTVYSENLEDLSDEEDYEAEEEADDEELVSEEEEEESSQWRSSGEPKTQARGKKRKLEDAADSADNN